MSDMGPVVSGLPVHDRPDTVCAVCAKAMWHRARRQGVRAFCRELRHITWQEGEEDPVTECDGQVEASHD